MRPAKVDVRRHLAEFSVLCLFLCRLDHHFIYIIALAANTPLSIASSYLADHLQSGGSTPQQLPTAPQQDVALAQADLEAGASESAILGWIPADRQVNKNFKSKHASKGSLKAAAKGAYTSREAFAIQF